MSSNNGAGDTPVLVLGLTILTIMLPSLWKSQVASVVPEPYLDEVFHVRQAQAYCAEQFHVWDPKITTPPGLYILAFGWNKLFGCDIDKLRFLNAILLGFFFTQLLFSRDIIDLIQRGKSTKSSQAIENFSFQDWFKAFNIITFPPLFFFSALFYTDVASTVIVYLYFQLFVNRLQSKEENMRKEVIQVGLGIVALLFRQTNVSWVAVFPMGLAVVQGIKALSHDGAAPKGPQSFMEVVQHAWNEAFIYDPSVAEAWLDDYIKCGISIAIVAALNLGKIITPLYPALMILNVFVAFVAWNGGVVLGDKSNHVATIHTPQMLYIWPYMLFFSWPLTLPTVYKMLHGLFSPPSFTTLLRRLVIFGFWTGLALVAVHFNTVVHPFILADNRHYTFYVFKLLRQRPILFYALTPVYVISAYLIIQTLGTAFPEQPPSEPSSRSEIQPKDGIAKSSALASPEELAWLCSSGVRTSFVLVWVVTTALTLITAPLVEPRYAILPWLFWRMHVPAISTSTLLPESVRKRVESRPPGRILSSADARMRLEMVWHLLINVATAWMFLYRGFEWPGKEYEGMVQRFMW